MITFRQKGDFSKLTRFLERAKEVVRVGDLDKYGREGVAALASATPVDTGLTANSWRYESRRKVPYQLVFITQIFKMEFRLQLFCSTDTQLVTEAGYKGEITSILRSSLFLTKLQMKRGGRSLNYEYDG